MKNVIVLYSSLDQEVYRNDKKCYIGQPPEAFKYNGEIYFRRESSLIRSKDTMEFNYTPADIRNID